MGTVLISTKSVILKAAFRFFCPTVSANLWVDELDTIHNRKQYFPLCHIVYTFKASYLSKIIKINLSVG